ncbi:MAG: hypothetical protein AAF843_13265 [Bacteroidota bacterium]
MRWIKYLDIAYKKVPHRWLLLILGLVGISCATDNAIPINPNERVDLGEEYDYMLFTRSSSSSNGFVTGFDSFPPPTVDAPRTPSTIAYPAISGGVSFQNFVVNQQKLFGGSGYQKVSLSDDLSPQDGSILETFGGGSSIVFANENKGYYTDFNTINIQIFDPETYNRIGEIDMSEAPVNPNNGANYFNDLYIRGNRMYACLYTGRTFPPFIYESEIGAIVCVIDLDTDTYIGSINKPGTKYPGQAFMRFKSNSIDENGDIYLSTQGGLGLEASGESTPAKILRIPAGTDDFDDYEFIPQLEIEGAAQETIVNAGFLYVGNGVAYTNVLMEEPTVDADLVNKPLMRWAKLNLYEKTAELVQGIPANAGLTTGMAYNYNGKVQLVVYNVDEQINAIYETDPTTNVAERKVDVVAGGVIYGLYEVLEPIR